MDTAPASLGKSLLYILAGLVLGAVVTAAGFFLFSQSRNNNSSSVNKNIFKLEIQNPAQTLVTNSEKFVVSGTTVTPSIVTISTPQKSYILESNGTFTKEIVLLEGKNMVTITAFTKANGESQTTSRDILYLNEDLNL